MIWVVGIVVVILSVLYRVYVWYGGFRCWYRHHRFLWDAERIGPQQAFEKWYP